MLGLRKPKFKTKIIPLENSHNAENPLSSIVLQNFKKLKGDRLESFEISSKKKQKMRNFNSLIVPKNLEKETLWDFLTFVLLQNIKQIEGRTLWGHKKIQKRSQSQKRESLILPKKVKTFCFGILVKN